MSSQIQFSPTLRFLITGTCVVIIIAGLKAAAPMLNTFLLSLLIAMSISPLPSWLMRKRMSPGIAVFVTLVIVVIGGIAVVSLLGVSITRLIQTLPAYQTGLTELRDGIYSFLKGRGIDLPRTSFETLNPGRIVQFAGTFLTGIAQTLGSALMVVFITALLLLEFAVIQYRIARGEDAGSVLHRLDEYSADIRKYAAITGATGLIQAIANTILLMILGVDSAVTWGVLFFFFSFIPAFGTFLALIPPALIALLESGWERAAIVVIGYLIVNFVGDNVIKPRFMKKGLEISVLLVILSLIFWNWVLGPVGMILAVPLTLSIKKILSKVPEENRSSVGMTSSGGGGSKSG
jgi:AI-2 transport protein TqsA